MKEKKEKAERELKEKHLLRLLSVRMCDWLVDDVCVWLSSLSSLAADKVSQVYVPRLNGVATMCVRLHRTNCVRT